MHLRAVAWSRWPFMYAYGGLVSALTFSQLGRTILYNKQLGLPLPRIDVTSSHGTVKATITVSRPLVIDAGQYVNIWVPSVSLFSSHPFTITSWSPDPVRRFELFIQRRQGFTSRLHDRAELHRDISVQSRMLFSGPHGSSLRVWDFEHVLLFVQDFGIAAALPHLQKLVHGRARGQRKTRRVHVLWHVNNIGIRRAVTLGASLTTVDARQAVTPTINDLFHADGAGESYVR